MPSHLSIVHHSHGGGLSARDTHRSLSLQAASDLPGVGLVGCGAGTDLTTVIITPCIDLEGQGGKSGTGIEHSSL